MKLTKGQQEKIKKAFKKFGFDVMGISPKMSIYLYPPKIITRVCVFTLEDKKQLTRAFKCLAEINKIVNAEQSRIGKGASNE